MRSSNRAASSHAYILASSRFAVDFEVKNAQYTEDVGNFENAIEHVETERDRGPEFALRREE